MKAIDVFSRNTQSMLKCSSCMHHYGSIIRIIDKSNTKEIFSVHEVDEDWEHLYCSKRTKENREECVTELEN